MNARKCFTLISIPCILSNFINSLLNYAVVGIIIVNCNMVPLYTKLHLI